MFPFQNKEYPEHLLDSTQISFYDINLVNYSYGDVPNESSAGGTLLHIGNHLSYKPRIDLFICIIVGIDSSFIKSKILKKLNVTIGDIHKHPNIGLDKFNNSYYNPLVDNSISKIIITLYYCKLSANSLAMNWQ